MSGAAVGVARWTSRAYLFLGAGVALAVVALVLRDPVPLFLALPLLVAPFAVSSTIPRRLVRVDLTWGTTGLGADVGVRGSLTGTFDDAAAEIVVDLLPPSGVDAETDVGYERGEREVRFAADWRAPEPTITVVAPPTVSWHDSLGLSARVLPGDRPSLTLERYPQELRGLSLVRLERTVDLPGETRSRRFGPAGEYFDLHEAATNEPARRINWTASGRAGRLMANGYQLERTGDMVVVLDARQTPLGRAYDERLLGVARAAAYGIGESFLRNKVRVGYAAFGEFVQAIPLASGRIHRLRILHAVLATRLSEVAGPGARCAIELRKFYPQGVTTLVVSSCAGDPSFDLAPYIRREGLPVLTLSPSTSPLRFGGGRLGPEDEQLARRIERLERRDRLASLWTSGPVIDWDDYWSLDSLVAALRQPARRRVS